MLSLGLLGVRSVNYWISTIFVETTVIGHGKVQPIKIRKKGDWANLHIKRQAANLLDYEQNWGYCARFAVGLEHAKKLVSWYFDLPYEENGELF